MTCRACRSYLESRPGSPTLEATAESAPPAGISAHLETCRACREYAQLRQWTRNVVQAGAIAAPEPPPVAAVWAAIRRQSATSWEGSWTRSFLRLVPYLASITVLFLLAGSLALGGAAPAASASPSIPSLLSPTATVASSMPVNVAVQNPADWLGVGAP